MTLSDRIRTAFVTGAGSGLGAAFVGMLLAEGVRVWGTSRTPERLTARPDFSPLHLELGEPRSIDAAWSQAEAESGGVDLVINNGGAAIFGRFAAAPDQSWDRQMAVLLHGPVRVARHALLAMNRRDHGTIVNVTSLAVELPVPYMSAYNAGKSALAAFTATLQDETAGSSVVVLDFRPGDYRTDFNRAMYAWGGVPTDDERVARVWARLENLLERAPPPERAARDLRRALLRGRPALVRSGGFFQTRLAPWGNRLLPARIMRLLRGFYFRTKT